MSQDILCQSRNFPAECSHEELVLAKILFHDAARILFSHDTETGVHNLVHEFFDEFPILVPDLTNELTQIRYSN
ncbi:MAG: hypothetical protein GY847_30065 [Proteobacteria bacterium]|nr:hypothetical protein [Pseudomonadota bacterium]